MMKTLLLAMVVILIGGCASHGVRCDGRLEPINGVASSNKAHPVAR